MSEQHDIDQALAAWTPMEPPADFADRVLAVRSAPPVARKRTWMLAAPIAAVAMIVVVAFFAMNTAKKSADESAVAPSVQHQATDTDKSNANALADPNADMVRFPAAGSGSPTIAMNQPVVSDAGIAPSLVDEAATDIAIVAGESVTIHDPAPITTLHVDFHATCPTGATVSVRPAALRGRAAPQTASGLTRAVLKLDVGAWAYEVACQSGSSVTATGTITIVRDASDKKLEKDTDQGPQLYIGAIRSVPGEGSAMTISGSVLAKWSLSIDGEPVRVRNGRFSAKTRGFSQIVIRGEHPTRGVQFFLTNLITR